MQTTTRLFDTSLWRGILPLGLECTRGGLLCFVLRGVTCHALLSQYALLCSALLGYAVPSLAIQLYDGHIIPAMKIQAK